MNYPISRNLSFRAFAWHMAAMRFRRWRHWDSRIAWRSGRLGVAGAKMTCSSLRTSGNVRPSSAFSPQPPCLQDQEPHRQHHQGHVVVEAAPAADLIVVQAQLLLAARETVLDRPAVMPRLRQLQQRAIRPRIAQVVLDVGGLVTAPLDHQPQLRPRQVVPLGHQADRGEVRHLDPLGPLAEPQPLPGAGRQRGRDRLDRLRLRLARSDPRLARAPAPPPRSRLLDLGAAQPATARLGDLADVALAQLLQAAEELGVLAITFVERHPAMADLRTDAP